MTLHVVDLIDLPYRSGGLDPATGVDCRWASRRALERIFPDFAPAEMPETPEEEEAMLAAIDAGSARWKQVGTSAAAASRLGDLIHTRQENGQSGLAVVIDRVGRIAITATPERGVHTIPVRRLPGVVAVLRRGA